MRLLLDTHSFLWFILNDPKLSTRARGLIEDPNNDIDISPASYWEIAIKISIGKYALPLPFDPFMDHQLAQNQFRTLHILPRHVAAIISMTHHHRDPFDRLIIAQSLVERIPVISDDPVFDSYGVTRMW